jgi:hypothetical protein
MAEQSNSRDRDERLALLEQKVELLLCLHCGIVPTADKGGLTDEQWKRFVEVGNLARGYFGYSYVATGEGAFSDLQTGKDISYQILSLAHDRPHLHAEQTPELRPEST